MNRLFGERPMLSWQSIYYFIISSMLIYALPFWSLSFVIGFPLFLLSRHFKVMSSLKPSESQLLAGSNDSISLQDYRTKLSVLTAQRSTKIRLFRVNLNVFFSLLVVAEFGLSLSGYEPGMIVYNFGFKPVEQLEELDGYITDELGILHIQDEAREFNEAYIKKGELEPKIVLSTKLYAAQHDYTPYTIGWDFLEAKCDLPNSNFSRFVRKVEEKKSPNSLDSAYLNYFKVPINADGFRSIAFENHITEHKKVLLLGDSFTWGAGTENVTASFADELSCMGFAVYNTGIIGVGMPQYAAIAEYYGDVIQPDVVVVNVFLGNDIVEHKLVLKPFVPEYFRTNAGTLLSAPHGKQVYSAQAAYDRIIDQSTIPKKANLFNWLCGQTRITTLFWGVLKVAKRIDNTATASANDYWDFVNSTKIGYRVNFERLAEIKATCERLNCRMIVSIIPDKNELDISKAEISKRIGGFPFVKIPGLTVDDYGADAHFNDLGHHKYAAFLAKHLNLHTP